MTTDHLGSWTDMILPTSAMLQVNRADRPVDELVRTVLEGFKEWCACLVFVCVCECLCAYSCPCGQLIFTTHWNIPTQTLLKRQAHHSLKPASAFANQYIFLWSVHTFKPDYIWLLPSMPGSSNLCNVVYAFVANQQSFAMFSARMFLRYHHTH